MATGPWIYVELRCYKLVRILFVTCSVFDKQSILAALTRLKDYCRSGASFDNRFWSADFFMFCPLLYSCFLDVIQSKVTSTPILFFVSAKTDASSLTSLNFHGVKFLCRQLNWWMIFFLKKLDLGFSLFYAKEIWKGWRIFITRNMFVFEIVIKIHNEVQVLNLQWWVWLLRSHVDCFPEKFCHLIQPKCGCGTYFWKGINKDFIKQKRKT